MTIALFDKFLNTLPQAVLEAKDISMVIMIDPPEGLPPPLLAGRGILSTEAKTIDVYNAEGSAVEHTFDISGTDLTPITEELEAVKATANTADDLSKDNKQRLDAIDLSKYAELDKDVQFNVLNLTSKINLTDPEGSEVNFNDALKFNNGGFTKLTILNGSIDVNTQISMGGSHQIINLASGGDNDSNAATIGDVKKISTEGSGLKPTDNEWDMLSLPVTNVATSELATSAATVSQVNAVESKADSAQSTANAADTLSKANEQKINNLPAPPDLSNYIQNGDDAELTSVAFTEASSIHFRPESGLILESDSICGEDTSGNKTFIIKDGEFDLKTKVITNVSDGVGDTDAVTKGQLNTVEGKVDANTSSISEIKSTADAADSLSKQNKTTLDNLPPDPTSRVAALEADALQKNESGFDAKSFKILNLDSGEDVDTSAATIGDVKRIATDGSGLKPTDNEWDMLTLPIINVAESEESNSAATVGQVNAVDGKIGDVKSTADSAKSKAEANESSISSLTETVSGNTTTIGQVKSTADAADTLSKANATRIDNLPPPPDLSGYVKNGDDVNFGTAEINIAKVTKGDDNTKFSDILIDGNSNTQLNFVGDTHFFIRNKDDNTKGLEAFQIDSSARFVAKQKVKTPIITNLGSGTTNSNSDKAAFIDLSIDNEVKLGAKSKVSFNVGGNGIIEAAAAGLKFLRDADANSHTISNMGDLKFNSGYQIEGSTTGNLKIRNAEGFYKNDSTDNNSIRFDGDDLRYKSEHHMFYKNASTSQLFGISDAGANLFNHNLKKVKHILANSAGSMNVSGIHILKRDDEKDANQSIQFNTGDITSYSDKHEWKTNDNARRLTIENHEANWHDCPLTSVNSIWGGDNDNTNGIKFETGTGNVKNHHYAENHIFFNNAGQAQFEVLPTGISAHSKHIRYVGQGSSDTDATNLGHIKELIAANGGGGAIEFKKIKKNVTGSPQYIYHNGDNHLFIEYTGNAGTIALDTMRKDVDDQVEDMFVVHNKTDTTCYIRLFFDNESVVHGIAPRSYSHGWANRVIGEWVVTAMKDPNHVPEQRVIKIADLTYSSNSDPRQVTKNIINAMPINSILIARHESGSSKKDTANRNRFISRGDANACESEECIAIIVKHSTDRATGMSTTQGGDGKAWSRVLDGKRHAWFTNDTANSFSLSSDIDLTQYPEDQLFLTGDKGMMISTINEDGDSLLQEVTGYNVPKNESDIAALEVQTEKNRSVTHYFINEGSLSYDYPDSERKPLVEVQVLNTMQQINDSSVTVTDNAEHVYGGEYNTIGSLAINSSGNWANQYVYHNAYKHVSEDYYVVFNQGNASWQIIQSENPHTSIGSKAAAVTVQLGGKSSLPESFGDYVIDPNFDNIDSLEFITAEVPVQYDETTSRVLINFNGAKPSGYVILK